MLDAQTEEIISHFFLDPFSRPQEKLGGAWMDECVGNSGLLGLFILWAEAHIQRDSCCI